jgi:hypothetical protein
MVFSYCLLAFVDLFFFPFVKLHRESDFDEIEAWLGDGQVRTLPLFVIFLVGENDSWVVPVALLDGPVQGIYLVLYLR